MTTIEAEPDEEVGRSLAGLHPMVRGLPGMADLDKRESKLQRISDFRTEAWQKDNDRFKREEARYNEKCAEADEALTERPKRHHKGAPDMLERRREIETLRNQREELARERLEIIGAHADTLTAQLLDLEADSLGQAREAVAVLDGLGPQLEALRETLRKVNLAANRPVRTGGGRVTAGVLVDTVHDGETILQPSGTTTEVTRGAGITQTIIRKPPKPEPEPEFKTDLNVWSAEG